MRNNEFENYDELRKLHNRHNVLNYMKTLDELTNKMIVENDLLLLRKCDGLVAVFKEPTIGTAQEIFAAWFLYRMPVYVICGEYTVHPWIAYIVKMSGGKAFKYRKEFERWLERNGLKKE
jgi:hypothetical protein